MNIPESPLFSLDRKRKKYFNTQEFLGKKKEKNKTNKSKIKKVQINGI